jgi:hypothetical protein
MTPQVGFEPTTNRLTVDGSAAEILRIMYSPKGKRVTGIEPVTRAWKARMLPLHHTRKATQVGLEPTTDCLEGSCSIQLSY